MGGDADRKASSIPGFRILGKLGQGGMGAVYRAVQESLGREVALKVVSMSAAKDPVFLERFFREAKSAGRLNHPNIVQGIDAGQTEKYCWIAMELVTGGSVGDGLKKLGRYTEPAALAIVTQIARGLLHAHEHGIIHRDIKPENFLLDSKGTAKLCDLGIAKAPADPGLTQEGRALGTPRYISPEQAQGLDTLDGRTDIYSLGISWYHMLAGEPPFDGPTAAAIMMKHIREPLPPLTPKCPGLSMPTALVIERMVAKDPEQRYHDVAELLQDLEALAAGKPPRHAARGVHNRTPRGGHPHAPRESSKNSKETPVLTYVGIGGAVAVALIIMGLFMRGGSSGGRVAEPGTVPVAAPAAKPAPKPVVRAPAPPAPAPTTTKPAETAGTPAKSKETDEEAAPAAPRIPTPKEEAAALKLLDSIKTDLPTMPEWMQSAKLEELSTRYPGTVAATRAAEILDTIHKKMAVSAASAARQAAKTAYEDLPLPGRALRAPKKDRAEMTAKLLREYEDFIKQYPESEEAGRVRSWVSELKTGGSETPEAPMVNLDIPADKPMSALEDIADGKFAIPAERVLPFLKHDDTEVRRMALRALYKLDSAAAGEQAEIAVKSDPAAPMRMLATTILERAPTDNARSVLQAVSESDADPNVRKSALDALRRMP